MDFRFIFEFLICIFYSSCQTSLVNEDWKRGEVGNVTLRCPSYGVFCEDHFSSLGNNTKNWEECASQCANDKDCIFWTWYIADHPIHPNTCILRDACEEERHVDYISGQYDCSTVN
ncbi:uncharacterized protein LOC111717374 [Eurytemora carolleeae]|uniref:uncharacterized protein LOC111717374 n=1 Tax=Eurytemora carolleeae TaxID=1294199 RepID=UPI000C776986|nr:uncharacterized protein LOC111717374 [Eurytemora carolleeae]|eukprot:XP_023348640.1 uncharacterized protein LOC111717374 [Eurytemora affinis]